MTNYIKTPSSFRYSEDIAFYIYSSQLQTYKFDAYNLCFNIAHVNKVFNYVIVYVLSWRRGMAIGYQPKGPGFEPRM